MALLKRTEFQTAAKQVDSLPDSQVYLFFGERYLCKQAADTLQKALLSQSPGAIHTIDGNVEDPSQTLSRLLSFSLLPGKQIYRVSDSRIFHSKTVVSELWNKAVSANDKNQAGVAKKNLHAMVQAVGLKIDSQTTLSEIPAGEWKKLFAFEKPGGDIGWAGRVLFETRDQIKLGGANLVDQYIEAFEKGLPQDNKLILTAETVDKRQRLFTYIKKNGTIVDCTVAAGGSKAAEGEQKAVLKEMMLQTLTGFKKKIDSRAVELFFERVGFHPVAVVTETEKLAHYVGDRANITSQDLEAMVARNREDALYELTDAFGKRQVSRALVTLNHLLEQGTHSLAILATLRNYLRRLLIFRSLQMNSTPAWRRGMNAKEFQNRYLPDLKAQDEWKELLGGHPYALYMSFTKASEYSCAGLKRWLSMLLEAEFLLKGSPLPHKLILEELILSMLRGSPKRPQ